MRILRCIKLTRTMPLGLCGSSHCTTAVLELTGRARMLIGGLPGTKHTHTRATSVDTMTAYVLINLFIRGYNYIPNSYVIGRWVDENNGSNISLRQPDVGNDMMTRSNLARQDYDCCTTSGISAWQLMNSVWNAPKYKLMHFQRMTVRV